VYLRTPIRFRVSISAPRISINLYTTCSNIFRRCHVILVRPISICISTLDGMAGFYLYILGFIFTLLTISCFALDSTKRATLLQRYRLRWAPETSPPLKTRHEGATLPPGQEYKHTFPPSRRPALANLTDSRFSVGSASEKGLAEQGHGSDKYKCLPDKQNVLAPQYKHHSTPTGFTVEEIEALGSFPDHATLSGVPSPAAYTNFDIHTALPRPYRPFRWEYHQTMCKPLYLLLARSCSHTKN
jgi:hypothetical protein